MLWICANRVVCEEQDLSHNLACLLGFLLNGEVVFEKAWGYVLSNGHPLTHSGSSTDGI